MFFFSGADIVVGRVYVRQRLDSYEREIMEMVSCTRF